jgi:hypothetical protein
MARSRETVYAGFPDSHGGCLITIPMKATALIFLAAVTASLFSSCAAGRVDRRHYNGPADRVEDYYDKRENVNDKLRGRRGLLY